MEEGISDSTQHLVEVDNDISPTFLDLFSYKIDA